MSQAPQHLSPSHLWNRRSGRPCGWMTSASHSSGSVVLRTPIVRMAILAISPASNLKQLELVAKVLGIPSADLAICKDTVIVLFRPEATVQQRDDFTKALYGVLVAWVVKSANHSRMPSEASEALRGTGPPVATYKEFCINYEPGSIHTWLGINILTSRAPIERAKQVKDQKRIIREEQQLLIQAHEQPRAMSTPQHGGSFSKPIDLLAGTEPYNHQWSIKSGSASNPPQFDLTAPLGAFPNSSQSTQQAGSPNTTPVRNHKAESSAPTLTPPSAPGATQKLSKAASNINPKFIPAAETTPHPDSSSSASLKSTGHHHTQAHHHPRLNISRARQAAALKLHALSSLSSKSDSPPPASTTSTATHQS
ncbi:hypothetical protein PCANC_21955 [Puccinia coronata f. sp. avenae]|uniref:Uncharacterized protein n=1 Tax=Puccinia coronata f. sp. avenae TaxID=200324 RepID=A0A2N5U5H2_9BASI|nr:hypothetical protein PCANC_21955 [Puccinia coronata f. sp. avenae]